MHRQELEERPPVLAAVIVLLAVTGPAAAAPVAAFIADVTAGPAPLTVKFTGLSTGSPAGQAWFFGDENFTVPWGLANASPGWIPRAYHEAVVLPDAAIVLMGGWGGFGWRNDTWRSADRGFTWLRVNASPGWAGRIDLSAVVLPDASIVLTGGETQAGMVNDTWRSRDRGVTWARQSATAGWIARQSHSSVALPDGSIVLTGGRAAYGSGYRLMDDVWRSADRGVTWALVNASPGWDGRWGHSTVALPDGSIVLAGGTAASMVNDTWRSADKGATWTLLNTSSGWTGRHSHSMSMMPDGSIVLAGGIDSTGRNDTWRSADTGRTWTLLSTASGWPARWSHSAVVLPDAAFVLTGGRDHAGPKNDVWLTNFAGSSEKNPIHTYSRPGTYPVTLQVFNATGKDRLTKAGFINVMPVVTTLPGCPSPPTDPDGDGIYEDLNGNNRLDFADVVLFFSQMTWIAANEPVEAFDLNRNGRIDFADIVALFGEV